MAVYNSFNPDNRVFRAADAIQEMGYDVTLLAYHSPGLPLEEVTGKGFRVIRIVIKKNYLFPKQLRNYLNYRSFKKRAKRISEIIKPQFVHCHDYNTLFLGVYCKTLFGSRLIYDCHEYFQDLQYLHRYPLLVRKRIAAFERKVIKKKVDEMITVSPGIAQLYRVHFPKNILVIRNIPDKTKSITVQAPSGEIIKFLTTQTDLNRKLFLYLGTNSQKGRGLDFIFDLLRELPDEYGMVTFGAKSLAELDYLKSKAEKCNISQRYGAFFSLPIEQLHSVAKFFYMGFSLIEPIYVSYYHSLPNKLFEYFSMDLPVISSEIPDQSEIILKHNAGLIVPFDLDRARQIILNASTARFNKDISKLYSWESEKKLFGSLYN